jgi:hypothetical protein
MDALAEITEDMTDRVGGVMAGVIQKKVISGRTVKAAAAAAISKAVVDIVKRQISGRVANDISRRRTTAIERRADQYPPNFESGGSTT